MMKMKKVPDATNGNLTEKLDNHVHDMTSRHKIFDEQQEEDAEATGKDGGGHGIPSSHPTSYSETMMHLFKGNIGPGLFAMGDAFKNCGILLAPFLTVALGIVCVHSQHILVGNLCFDS
jgi:Transmembrane amino acid transporter protein